MVRRIANMIGTTEGLAVLLSLLSFFYQPSYAQSSVSSNATIISTLLKGVSISASAGSNGTGDLDFGFVVDNKTYSINAQTSPTAGLYTVNAAAGIPMTVTYSSPSVSLSDGAGDYLSFAPQVVGSQSASSQATATTIVSSGNVTMNPTGYYYIWLGGAVTVPKGQIAGTYTGMFSITVSY